jgi:hypothetical protein
LKKLTEHRCPECGGAFHPADPTTFATQPPAKRRRFVVRAVVLVAISYLLSFTFIYRHQVLYNKVVAVRWSTSKMLKEAVLGGMYFFPFFLAGVLVIYGMFLHIKYRSWGPRFRSNVPARQK